MPLNENRDLGRIFNIQIKEKVDATQSTLSELNDNSLNNGIFSTKMMEKIKGSCLDSKKIVESDAFCLKQKIDSSITELNTLYEGFIK